MSKKDGNIIIGSDVVDRIINLCERTIDKIDESDKRKEYDTTFVKDFIKEEIIKVQTEMGKVDILDEKYIELLQVYNKLCDIIRWW